MLFPCCLHGQLEVDTAACTFSWVAAGAAAAVDLASEDTAWVTGQVMQVDGGVSAGIAIPSFDQFGTDGYVLDKRVNKKN